MAIDWERRIKAGISVYIHFYRTKFTHFADRLSDEFVVEFQTELADTPPGSSTIENGHEGNSLPESIGEFSLERELGRGGMGIVYAARQQSLDRKENKGIKRKQRGQDWFRDSTLAPVGCVTVPFGSGLVSVLRIETSPDPFVFLRSIPPAIEQGLEIKGSLR